MKSLYADELRNRVCLPHYIGLQKEKSMKIISLPLYGNTEDSHMTVPACPYDRWATVKRQKGDCASFLTLHDILQSSLSKRIAWYTLLQSQQSPSLPWSHEAALKASVSQIVSQSVEKSVKKEVFKTT